MSSIVTVSMVPDLNVPYSFIKPHSDSSLTRRRRQGQRTVDIGPSNRSLGPESDEAFQAFLSKEIVGT